MIARIFGGAWSDPAMPLLMFGLIAASWLYQFLCESSARKWLEYSPVRISLATGMMLYLFTVPGAVSKAFIYFQF